MSLERFYYDLFDTPLAERVEDVIRRIKDTKPLAETGGTIWGGLKKTRPVENGEVELNKGETAW